MAKKIKKSKANGLYWDFPSTNHGREDGFSDPAIEFFEGDHNRFIARETIQNAVDARLDYKKPVKVVFEKFDIPAKSVPGRETLRDRMKNCLEFVPNQERAERFFKSAIGLLKGNEMPVLKISDFNTLGLSGSDTDRNGNWYRLVRVTGTSSPKGVGGGSFGIGKGAPFAGSGIRTIFYSSINDKSEPVFQGVSRLVSHYDEGKDVRQGIGFYGIDGYKAIRQLKLVPDLFKRDARGTDIFIMGYKSEGDWQAKLIRSVLHNFWLTILHGDLEITVKNGKETLINRETLKDILEEYDAEDARFFFESVTNSTQTFEQELKHLGRVSLFVRKQDSYPSKIMMARKPKMLVQERQYRALREPYAGVVICDDDRGNTLLRDLEPPAHDKWDKDRAVNGWAALRELDNFIKQSLKSMGEAITTEPQDIPGLDKYLPDSEDRDYIAERGAVPLDATELATDEETGREIGKTKEATSAEIEKVIRKGIVTNRKPGKVKPNFPVGPGTDPRGIITGKEDGKKEGMRIRTSSINFRSFAQKTKGGLEYYFAITGREDCEGAVRLIAVGDDGNYPVDIKTVHGIDSKKNYEVDGSMIKGISVKNGKTVRLTVRLESKKKYSLGIENYEG